MKNFSISRICLFNIGVLSLLLGVAYLNQDSFDIGSGIAVIRTPSCLLTLLILSAFILFIAFSLPDKVIFSKKIKSMILFPFSLLVFLLLTYSCFQSFN